MKYRIVAPGADTQELYQINVNAMPGTLVMTGRGGVYWRVEGVCLDDQMEYESWVFDLEPIDPHDIAPELLIYAIELPVPYEHAVKHIRRNTPAADFAGGAVEAERDDQRQRQWTDVRTETP